MPYAVMVGLAGCYMPNSCEHYRTRKDAESGARWWANTFRDDSEDPCFVSGSAKEGYYFVGRHECIEIAEIDWEDFCGTCPECGHEESAIKSWDNSHENIETTCGCKMSYKRWCREVGK